MVSSPPLPVSGQKIHTRSIEEWSVPRLCPFRSRAFTLVDAEGGDRACTSRLVGANFTRDPAGFSEGGGAFGRRARNSQSACRCAPRPARSARSHCLSGAPYFLLPSSSFFIFRKHASGIRAISLATSGVCMCLRLLVNEKAIITPPRIGSDEQGPRFESGSGGAPRGVTSKNMDMRVRREEFRVQRGGISLSCRCL